MASLKLAQCLGGSNMRGDQKWPPEEYKRQSEVDNEERRKLAQQPAFRPRRQQKLSTGTNPHRPGWPQNGATEKYLKFHIYLTDTINSWQALFGMVMMMMMMMTGVGGALVRPAPGNRMGPMFPFNLVEAPGESRALPWCNVLLPWRGTGLQLQLPC
uniref:Uncharacterized protein n=1 Tax=Anopheles culicifacies TaxID=139723 RepID=A0A182MI59_9DIPT